MIVTGNRFVKGAKRDFSLPLFYRRHSQAKAIADGRITRKEPRGKRLTPAQVSQPGSAKPLVVA